MYQSYSILYGGMYDDVHIVERWCYSKIDIFRRFQSTIHVYVTVCVIKYWGLTVRVCRQNANREQS